MTQDITYLLEQLSRGERASADELLPLVYDELRKLARGQLRRERVEHTLQATALVHEAYLRVAGGAPPNGWEGRRHFFAAAAEAMRRILIDSARRKNALKRGSQAVRLETDDAELAGLAMPWDPDTLLDLDEALQRLVADDQEAAELVKLRLFAGLTVTEAGECLGLSRSAAYRLWEYARSWFAVHASGLAAD
ncbi:MAG: ECF-type sigma factor [Pirellulales bacterium]